MTNDKFNDEFGYKTSFKSSLKFKLMRQNGCFCKLCSKQITYPNTIEPINAEISFEVHHVKPVRRKGLGVKSNALVCCNICHAKLHLFIDIFYIKNNDFKFFTAVYIYLFLPEQKNKAIYKDYPLNQYAKSLKDLARTFRNKIKAMPLAHYMLLQYYMFDLKCYFNPIVGDFISKSYNYERLIYKMQSFKDKLYYLKYTKEYSKLTDFNEEEQAA